MIAEKLGADPQSIHSVTFVNCHGKWTIPGFLRVLNQFNISYSVIYDDDADKHQAQAANVAIKKEMKGGTNHLICENCFEHMLGMTSVPTRDKPLECFEWVTNHELEDVREEMKQFIKTLYGLA